MDIGYIGLGALGGELAKRFLGKHVLHVWDLNPEALQRFEALGARPARSAAELATRSKVILTCLPRSCDVDQMVFGPEGLARNLQPGTLIIDQTSGVPEQTREIARRLAESGVLMMDAAVSASPLVVAQGLTTLMASGPDEAYELALPILRVITETIYRCGSRVGDGQAMKMVNNAMNGACRVGTLEVVALGRKLGLPLSVITQVLNHGPASNQTTDKMLPAIEQGRESTNFALALMLKDVNQAVALGMSNNAPMPVSAITRGVLSIGLNKLGPSSRLEDVIGVIETMAGTRIAPQGEAAPAVAASRNRDYKNVGHLHGAASGSGLALSGEVRSFASDDPDVRALMQTCDAILLDLDDEQAESLFFGQQRLADSLKKDTLLVQVGTGDPARLRSFRKIMAGHGVEVVDAPVHVELSDAAKACQPFGAPAEKAADVQQLLESLNAAPVYCGPPGSAREAALVRDSITAMCLAIALECITAGYKYGLALRDMATVLNRGSAWSGASRLLLTELSQGRSLSSGSAAKTIQKLKLATQLAIEAGVPLLSLDAARSQLEAAANRAGNEIGAEAFVQHYECAAQARLT